jgi:flagellar biosynthetic protein FliP
MSTHAAANRRTAVLTFTRHYVEMAGAMLVGMVVLGRAESLLASAAGHPHALAGVAVPALAMAANMTVGVAVWMWLRGHRLRLTGEMVVGMTVGFLALAPQWTGAAGHHAPMMAGHELMFLGMFVAMFARRQHYTATATRRGDGHDQRVDTFE